MLSELNEIHILFSISDIPTHRWIFFFFISALLQAFNIYNQSIYNYNDQINLLNEMYIKAQDFERNITEARGDLERTTSERFS